MNKNVTMIVDLQYGSTGKGLIAGYWAEEEKPDMIVNANMPNAGHTYINADGRTWIHKVLPNGIVSPNLKRVMIGPGSVFDFDQLMKEIKGSADLLEGKTILIHENATVLRAEDGAREQGIGKSIGSTAQGSAEAMIRKIRRKGEPETIVRDVFPPSIGYCGARIVRVSHRQYVEALLGSDKVLAEAAQGYSLGIDQHFYPYTTSRNCTPARFMSDMAIPLPCLDKVIGTLRTYPIRVGGTSGPGYSDQKEILWSAIGVQPELTTVTKKERRVFTFSVDQLNDALRECQPDQLFLNFANYCADQDELADLASIIEEAFRVQTGKFHNGIRWIGYGPKSSDITSMGAYLG